MRRAFAIVVIVAAILLAFGSLTSISRSAVITNTGDWHNSYGLLPEWKFDHDPVPHLNIVNETGESPSEATFNTTVTDITSQPTMPTTMTSGMTQIDIDALVAWAKTEAASAVSVEDGNGSTDLDESGNVNSAVSIYVDTAWLNSEAASLRTAGGAVNEWKASALESFTIVGSVTCQVSYLLDDDDLTWNINNPYDLISPTMIPADNGTFELTYTKP